MTRIASPVEATRSTVADLLKRLGGIPADRVRLIPTPGTATEQDVLAVLDREKRPCELVDGTLVEKVMGFEEGRLAVELISILNHFSLESNLGIVTGPDSTLKLTTGLLRIPDVSFISFDHLPGRRSPRKPIPRLTIDLAIEVISKGNTRAEMSRKLREYFEAGTRLVWFVYPKSRTIRVYTSVVESVVLKDGDMLDGGAVLPGFALSVSGLFDRANRGQVK